MIRIAMLGLLLTTGAVHAGDIPDANEYVARQRTLDLEFRTRRLEQEQNDMLDRERERQHRDNMRAIEQQWDQTNDILEEQARSYRPFGRR